MSDLSAPYDPDWTVQRALDAYFAENGFTVAAYDAHWFKLTFWGIAFPLPNPPSRKRAIRQHDLHHLATGYGTDLAGEAEVSAWEMERGLQGTSLVVRGLVASLYIMGLIFWRGRVREACRHARARPGSLRTVFEADIRTRYPEILAGTVGELRAQLGIPPGGLALSRALHAGAPAAA